VLAPAAQPANQRLTFINREWTEDGELWVQYVSSKKSARADVIQLQVSDRCIVTSMELADQTLTFRKIWGIDFLKEERRKREYALFERKLTPRSLVR
jgi:hypothetical protein